MAEESSGGTVDVISDVGKVLAVVGAALGLSGGGSSRNDPWENKAFVRDVFVRLFGQVHGGLKGIRRQ